jgi:hypothetical protein
MAKKRKEITLLVTVSVPKGLPVSAAKREVRSLVNDQCEYNGYVPGTFDEINMKVKRIRSAPKGN